MDTLAAFHKSLIDPLAPIPANTISPRGTPDPLRFAVYRNNVHVSLVNALAAKFPVTRKVVGEDFFTGMARTYVGLHKPTSPLIMNYGGDFPAFAGAFPNTDALPYLADLVRLELLWSEAYNAAEAETIGIADLSAMPPEMLPDLRLAPHPAAHLLASEYPVGTIWGAHQQAPVAPISAWTAETVIIVRPHAEVGVHVIPRSDAPFAAALFAGRPLGLAALASEASDFDFGSALVGLLSLGAFGAIIKER